MEMSDDLPEQKGGIFEAGQKVTSLLDRDF